jgi:hypothetical protein
MECKVAMSQLAWAVKKKRGIVHSKKTEQEGDYWTQHAKNFLRVRQEEMQPKISEANDEQVYKVAMDINKELKSAAFEEGNVVALKVEFSSVLYETAYLVITLRDCWLKVIYSQVSR